MKVVMATVALLPTYSTCHLPLHIINTNEKMAVHVLPGPLPTLIFTRRSPWRPGRSFDQTSRVGVAVRFHLAAAVTKINDLIFVVPAR